MIGLLLAMYPARWRRRYGEEFRIVLESRPLGPFDFADVLLGAFDARLTHFRLPGLALQGGGHLMMLRIGGFGAIVGGILWFAGIAGMSAAGEPRGAWLAIAIMGSIGILAALVGLSAFQAHREPRLAWAAFAIPALGTLITLFGLVAWALVPSDWPIVAGWTAWAFWMLGTVATLFGSILFAVATLRAEVLSSRAASSLGLSAVLVVVLVSGGISTEGAVGQIVVALGLGSFAASWVALGLTALRRGPIRAIAPA